MSAEWSRAWEVRSEWRPEEGCLLAGGRRMGIGEGEFG